MWIDLALQDLVFLVLFLFLILNPLLHQPVDICGEQVDVMSDLSQFIMVVSKLPSFFIVKVTFYLDFSEVCK